MASASSTSTAGCSTSGSSSSVRRSTTQVANLVVAQLLHLESQDPDKDISIYINSPGGSIYSGLAIYDTMQFVKPRDLDDLRRDRDVDGLAAAHRRRQGQALLAAQQPDPDPPAVRRLRGPVDRHRDPRAGDPQHPQADRRDLRPSHRADRGAGAPRHGARPLLQARRGRRPTGSSTACSTSTRPLGRRTRQVAGARRIRPDPWPRVSSGSGTVGLRSAQKTISAPNTSIPMPVQRSTLIPAALVLTVCEPNEPEHEQDRPVDEEQAADQPADVEAVGDLGRLGLVLAVAPSGQRVGAAAGRRRDDLQMTWVSLVRRRRC